MPAKRTAMRHVREVLRLKFVGGVPTQVAVIKACLYEPQVNRTYQFVTRIPKASAISSPP